MLRMICLAPLALALFACPSTSRAPRPVAMSIAAGPATAGDLVIGDDLLFPELSTPPAKGVAYRDPVYGIPVTRVTDQRRDGYGDSGIKQEYARADPESSDGKRLVLRGNRGRWFLYDAGSFRMLRRLPIGEGGQEPEPRWDAKDPHLLYHLSGMKLMALDVETGASRVVRDFGADFPGGSFLVTGVEGDASTDRRYFCLIVKRVVGSDWQPTNVFVFDRTEDRVIGHLNQLRGKIQWVSMDMSGRHCLIARENEPIAVYSRDLRQELKLPPGARGHSDLALTADRKDVLVYQDLKSDWIAMADLDTGRVTNLLQIPFGVNPDLGLHFSGNAASVPGWVLVSTYGAKNVRRGKSRSWMDQQIFIVELRHSPLVWRIAGARSFTFVNPEEGAKAYFAEPHAAINTRGTRVYWGANWGQTDLKRVELFMAQLPESWPQTLSAMASQ